MTDTARVFRREPMIEIIAFVEGRLAGDDAVLAFHVLDPDHGRRRYAGELVEVDGATYVHRPLRVWVDLAERLRLRLLLPRPSTPPLVELRFERLDGAASWQGGSPGDPTEKYGAASGFARISKLEDPGFVIDFAEALAHVRLGPRPRILDLGVNTGDEIALMIATAPPLAVTATFVGIDHSASALAVARARFPHHNIQLLEADLASIATLPLGRFDLVVSIGTLQSPGVDDRELLRRIVQHHLAPTGSVIFGLPNCRYVDGEVEYGARVKNLRQPELGLLVKDLAFYRKYLQQHHRQVFVTGKHYVLVTGVHAEPQLKP